MQSETMPQRAISVWLTILTVLSFFLRLALIPTRLLIENDGPYYVSLAAQLLHGNWSGALNDYWSQFYPVTIAFIGLFTHDIELAARLVSALCGAALVPAVWCLVNEMADPFSANLTALLTLFQPWLLVFSTLALTEMLFALLLVMALTLILRAGRLGGFRRFALAGGITGLAILTRSEGLLLVLALLGAGLTRFARHWVWQSVRENIVALLALVLVMTPQSIGTYQIYGHLNFVWKSSVNVALSEVFNTPSQAEQAVYSLDEQGQRRLNTQARQLSLGEYWLKHSEQAGQRIWGNAQLVWREQMTGVLLPMPFGSGAPIALVSFLVVLGIVTGLAGAKRNVVLGVLGFVAAYSFGLLSVLVHPRLLVPLIPFVLSFIALGCSGVAHVAQRVVRRFIQPVWQQIGNQIIWFVSGLIFMWALSSSYIWAFESRDPFFREEPVAQKEAGLWLRANASQTVKLLSHNPQMPFYFYETWPFDRALSLLWATPDDVLVYARQHDVSYIVLEEWIIRSAHFPVEPWLETTQSHSGLKLLKVFGVEPYRVIIYQRTD